MSAFVTSPKDVKQLGTILTVWAHPDDETFVSAGLLATAIKNGQRVVCVTATKGEAGSQDESRWPAETLGDVRANELTRVLKMLGVTEHHWLGVLDGMCDCVPNSAIAVRLQPIIDAVQPDTILTFGPDGWTGHNDHRSVSGWATELASKKTKVFYVTHTPEHYETYLKKADDAFNIFFNIDKPPLLHKDEIDIYFELPPDLLALKYNALRSMTSQTEKIFTLFDPNILHKVWATECFVLTNR